MNENLQQLILVLDLTKALYIFGQIVFISFVVCLEISTSHIRNLTRNIGTIVAEQLLPYNRITKGQLVFH